MRLVDAEKLEEYKADCCVSLTGWQEGWNDAIDAIMGETPTVEAIPIEWFEQHIKELDTELQSLYSRFCSQGDSKEKNEALLRCVELGPTLRAYETVLSEWRKENEIS